MEDVEIQGLDTPEVAAEEKVEKPKKPRKTKIVMDETVTDDLLKSKPKKPKKVKEEPVFLSVKETLMLGLKDLDVEAIKKPWMATKTFRLVTDPEDLRDWARRTLENKDKYFQIPNGEMLPVIAVDTETTGLDVRIVEGEINVDIAGVCLCSDGVEGIYVPITHEDDPNLDRMECAAILQELFDQSFLVFFNAKFDREIMRITMGIVFREYPYFEDVQVFNFLLDPKADVEGAGGKGGMMAQGGLKALSHRRLNIEQIELDSFTKIKVKYRNEAGKVANKSVYAPFNMVPTRISVWYAAADAICTWLLWKQMYKAARKITLANLIDHELVDTLGWVERQRYNIDDHRLTKTIKWQQAKLSALKRDMIEICGHEDLNPGSSPQLGKILFQERGMKPYKLSEKSGNPSTDGETLEELTKQHPNDPFLKKLMEFREYAALHPENLHADPRDGSARVFLKQNTVAGGRLAANGGDFEKDGGFGLNIQAIKAVSGNKWVKGRLLLEDIEDINLDDLPDYTLEDLHPTAVDEKEEVLPDGKKRKYKVARKGVVRNHLASWLGYTFCLVPNCKYCKEHYTVLQEHARGDANEVLNLRSLFIAKPGWTFFTIDYSNIEMRCAANISREPKFVDEFILGSGDFHTLTATVVFGDKFTKEPDKVKKKALRSMAKVLNFALLYGGTEHTIFENLKKNDPKATLEMARQMVEAYWAGVPVFAEWVKGQKALAENDLLILTATDRQIHFESALEEMRIHEPTAEDKEQYWQYRGYRKKANTYTELAEGLKADGAAPYEVKEAKERADYFNGLAVAMWRDERTGVRNWSDYNRFVGKIGRLSMNIPLQGLAGDMMRMALNACRKWAQTDIGVENALRLHGSVHDEIDPTVKNEWVPYIIPRLTRIMKLRKFHEERGWPVPIETDIEFGQSWDIEHHLTGDSEHKPSGYYDIDGMQGYIPMEWSEEFPRLCSMLGTKEGIAKVVRGLRKSLHERTAMPVDLLEKSETEEEAKKWLTISLQLDEYWRVDEGEDPYTLEEFEEFYGLERIPLPVGGFMGPLPKERLESIERRRLARLANPEFPQFEFRDLVVQKLILSPEEQETLAEAILNPPEPNEAMKKAFELRDQLVQKEPEVRTQVVEVIREIGGGDTVHAVTSQPEEDDIFAETPRRKAKIEDKPEEPVPVEEAVPEEIQEEVSEQEILIKVSYSQGVPVLRFMDDEDLDSLIMALGRGKKVVQVVYCGEIYEISNVKTTKIPKEYVFRMDQLERIENADSTVEGFKLEE
jgi:DNA polymerase I-like protein with 3'-5' exonuclease and polymerase domains